MKKRIRKFRFNLIEIALAMAVIAIGLSSILVLFPVAVNAGKDAVADNNLPDAAEYVLGLFRAGVMSDWYRGTDTFYKRIPETKPDLENSAYQNPTWKVFLGKAGDKVEKSNFLVSDKIPEIFRYQQVSAVEQPDGTVEYASDFSADILVWKEPIRNFYDFTNKEIKETTSDGGITTTDLMKTYKYAFQLNVEFSWPAEAPYANRSKRLYVLDMCNMNYDFSNPSKKP